MTTVEDYKKGPLDAMYERGYFEAVSKVFGICSKHIKRGKWLEREPKCLVCSHVSTTMDLYCHPTLKHKQECMNKIWE